MSEESEKKAPAAQGGAGGDEGKRSRRRYYRRRGKKKDDAGAVSTPGADKAPRAVPPREPAESQPDSPASPNSRRRRAARAKEAAPSRERSSTRRRSSSRRRRGRRAAPEPMVEAPILTPEVDDYVEPEQVYIYEYLIRPAYRDAGDYRPDSFSPHFDHSEGVERQLSGQYATQYVPQYPLEVYPEDAAYQPAEPVESLNFAAAIRAFYAENPESADEPEGDAQPEAQPEAQANPAPDA